ncbi:MAG: GAF domain-containing protein [Candidatus Hydrogenedentes bacterium]|nr:GAF domain-containing protein [Candidatus Hydrogenedentota bacterium]
MPQLVIEQPGVPTMTAPVLGAELRLGRAEDNDIVLVADEVSRHHAKMVRHGDKIVLVDLNSMNGTYVNRQRIAERVLSHLDEVWLGSKCLLVYRDDTAVGRITTHITPAGQDMAQEATLINDLDRIREEMDRVGDSLTLIGKRGKTPVEAMQTVVPEASPEQVVAMSRAYRRLDALYRASKLIASDFDLSSRLAAVLDTAIEVLEAERGFVTLRDEETGGLAVSVAREMGRDLQASSPSMGIAGRAAFDGEPVLMADRDNDSDFGGRESIIRQRIVSAMAVPLKVEDRVLGSIYLDTRQAGQPFDQEDLELFASLAAQSAMAIENVRLYEQMVEVEKKRANLGRFLSPAIVDEIMKEDKALELGGRKRIVTAMFCDIRGFTPIAERVSPDGLVAMLNEHFTAMTEIIFRFEGTLDKYIGDEIMAVFGSPLANPDDAVRCVRAALAIQAKNAELNRKRAQEKRPTFELGIGIATGEVIAGYIGSPDRMEFTVVGDRVNTARRLCSVAEPGQIITGQLTYERVKSIAVVREVGPVALKGKEALVDAYEIQGLKS